MATNPNLAIGRRPSRGKFRWKLLLWMIIFAGGFYAGVDSTKRAVSSPAWVQRLFGLKPGTFGIPLQTPPPAVATTPPVAPPASAATTPTPTPPASTTPVPAATAPETTPPPTKPEPEAASSAPVASPELDAKVREYNTQLRRIQEAQKNYDSARQLVASGKAGPQELQSALDKQNAYLDDLVNGVQRAQTLLDTLQGMPQYEEKYVEKERCLTADKVPPSLAELSVDRLHFLRPRN